MHQLPIEQQILLILEIVASAALCVRLWYEGLHRVYGYFFGYVLLEFFQALVPLLVPLESRMYLVLYVASQALVTGLLALIVLDLYSRVLRDLTGIASVSRRYIKVVLVLALAAAFFPLQLEHSKATVTGYFFSCERAVMSSLVAFVLLASVFLLYYPVPLGRNVVAYLMGFALYFLTHAALAFIHNVGYIEHRLASGIEMGVFVGCLSFWFLALHRQGEDKRMVVGHQWNPGDEERLRAQLDAINASLLRAGQPEVRATDKSREGEFVRGITLKK
jgi:hypothetical protein